MWERSHTFRRRNRYVKCRKQIGTGRVDSPLPVDFRMLGE